MVRTLRIKPSETQLKQTESYMFPAIGTDHSHMAAQYNESVSISKGPMIRIATFCHSEAEARAAHHANSYHQRLLLLHSTIVLPKMLAGPALEKIPEVSTNRVQQQPKPASCRRCAF